MKILLVNDDYVPAGQSSVAHLAHDLAAAYRAKGHGVHVLTSHRAEESPDILRTADVTSLPISYDVSRRHIHMLGNAAVRAMLKREMQAIRPDAVHVHNIHGYLTYDVLREARALTPNVVITMHDVMSFAYGRLATKRYLNSGGTDTKLSLLDHIRTAGRQYNPLRNRTIRAILRETDTAVVAPSHALKDALASNGIPGATVIPNGIDAKAWETAGKATKDTLSKRFGIGDRPVLLFGGRLSEDKGALPLLQAFRKVIASVPSALLLVVGDQKRWESLQRDAGAEDLANHVRCTGWLPREELPGLYALSTVVTTPSLCLDVFPTVNLEAMAAGKPVVGTVFGGTREAVEHGVTGFVVDPRDTETYAAHLTSLLSDPARAEKMGEAGRARVETSFTLELQADRYLALFNRS